MVKPKKSQIEVISEKLIFSLITVTGFLVFSSSGNDDPFEVYSYAPPTLNISPINNIAAVDPSADNKESPPRREQEILNEEINLDTPPLAPSNVRVFQVQ